MCEIILSLLRNSPNGKSFGVVKKMCKSSIRVYDVWNDVAHFYKHPVYIHSYVSGDQFSNYSIPPRVGRTFFRRTRSKGNKFELKRGGRDQLRDSFLWLHSFKRVKSYLKSIFPDLMQCKFRGGRRFVTRAKRKKRVVTRRYFSLSSSPTFVK